MTVKAILETMIPTQLIKINKPGNTGSDPLESGTASYLLANSMYLKDEVSEMYRCAIDTSHIAIHLLDKPRLINVNIYDNTTINGFKSIMDEVYSKLADMGFDNSAEMSCMLAATVSDGASVVPVSVSVARRNY